MCVGVQDIAKGAWKKVSIFLKYIQLCRKFPGWLPFIDNAIKHSDQTSLATIQPGTWTRKLVIYPFFFLITCVSKIGEEVYVEIHSLSNVKKSIILF